AGPMQRRKARYSLEISSHRQRSRENRLFFNSLLKAKGMNSIHTLGGAFPAKVRVRLCSPDEEDKGLHTVQIRRRLMSGQRTFDCGWLLTGF
ncbi:MAG: hypothetical protein WC383_10380, partial [Gammaproteobacteria bacterium]